jgi:hypothetical protein
MEGVTPFFVGEQGRGPWRVRLSCYYSLSSIASVAINESEYSLSDLKISFPS